MSFYGKWETWKIVYVPKVMNGGMRGVAFIEASTEALKKGDRISLVGFGTFSTTKHPARKGRNPQTGQEIMIAERTVVKFKAGAELCKGL